MEIYLIYSNESGYEASNELLGFKRTEDEAKIAVIFLKESYLKARKFKKEIINPAFLKFQTKNPLPEYPKTTDIPRWLPGMAKEDITQEMRDERKFLQDENAKILNDYSHLCADWRLREMKYINPLIQPVLNELWFKKWFEVSEQHINFRANGLVEGNEYIYEVCEELK